MTIAHFGVAIVAGLVGRDWRGHTVEGNICAGLICILLSYMSDVDGFTLSYGVSWGPIAWTIPSEIFPTRLRARGVALSTASNWVTRRVIPLTIDQQLFHRIDYTTDVGCPALGNLFVHSYLKRLTQILRNILRTKRDMGIHFRPRNT